MIDICLGLVISFHYEFHSIKFYKIKNFHIAQSRARLSLSIVEYFLSLLKVSCLKMLWVVLAINFLGKCCTKPTLECIRLQDETFGEVWYFQNRIYYNHLFYVLMTFLCTSIHSMMDVHFLISSANGMDLLTKFGMYSL